MRAGIFRLLLCIFLAVLCLPAGCVIAPEADGGGTEVAAGAEAGGGDEARNGAPETDVFTLPGLGRAFIFATPDPVIYWNEQPEGCKVQAQAALTESFEKPDIVFDAETQGAFIKLELNMDESSALFLRARRLPPFGGAEDWTPVVRISYKPLVIRMKSLGGYEMAVFEVTNELAAELINRLLPGGELIASADMIQGKDGTPYLGFGELNYGFQFGLDLRAGGPGEFVLEPRAERGEHPVVGFSWYGAAFICDSLSRMFGFKPAYTHIQSGAAADIQADGFRLPREAEWEYAARGPDSHKYPGGAPALNSSAANFLRSGDPFETRGGNPSAAGGPTTPVDFYDGGQKKGYKTANGVSHAGLYDMLGNVWEWCDDYFEEESAAGKAVDEEQPDGDVPAGEAGRLRVVRGTAWNTHRADVSFASRGFYKAGGFSYSLGLRLARTPKPDPKAGPYPALQGEESH
ncbi:MAG: formylglycine-generating enzyme family protein [Spirochaetales bacterium]|jgi:formylglycine-generating enzyme required for sulfatase activity|nr:formylglycine-generating enzyme family protein [Spirochaetales bacterium]